MRHGIEFNRRILSFARLVGVTIGTGVFAVSLSGATAFAYHCYNASISNAGREELGNAAAFVTLYEAFTLCGASDADATAIIIALIDGYDGTLANDYDESLWDIQISIAAHMAGGLEHWYSPNAEELWHNGLGIDHLGSDLESFLGDIYYVAWEVGGLDLDTC